MDNEGFSESKSPYKGIGFVIFFLTAVPCIVYTLFYNVISFFEKGNSDLKTAEAKCFTGIVCCCFVLLFIISGGIKKDVAAILTRLREFVKDLFEVGFSIAFKCYLHNLRELGVAFWIYFPFVMISVNILISGFIEIASLFNL